MYITESFKTPISGECDVLVAGGGVAGISAALAAARCGADVTLLESQYVLGGLATAGLVTIYLPLCDGMGHQVSYGISEELLRLSIKYGAEDMYPDAWLDGGSHEEKCRQRFQVRFNPHLFAISAEQLLLSEGVKIMYGSHVSAVHRDKNKIKSVIFENRSGRSAINVKSVIDTTGDAAVCHLANEKIEVFEIGNSLAAWYYHMDEKGYDLSCLGFADVPDDDGGYTPDHAINDRHFDALNSEDLSKMVQLSHSAILNDVLKRRKDGNDVLPVNIATIPQVRMTRRICGVNTLSTDSAKGLDDSIGMIANWRKRDRVYEVPFSALYGREVDNLITAGRCISSSTAMWDFTRVIPACAVTGEAAGTAAAMTDSFSSLDILSLQSALIKRGVKIR